MSRIDMPGYGLLTEPPSASDWPTCACCGTELPADGSWCAECEAAECGERDYRSAAVCMAEMKRKGFEVVGMCCERVQLRDRSIPLCRVEILRGPNGAHSYGRVLEVLT
jgi:hypothetical protein